jgi:hypothetical protein
MNIRGIECLRKLGLPGPNKETTFRTLSELDVDWIYHGARDEGLAIMAFDYSKPIDMSIFEEIKVRKYKVQRHQIEEVVSKLHDDLIKKGVEGKNIIFLANQMYTPKTIDFCGKAVICVDRNGIGKFHLDAVESLRKDSQEFSHDFAYSCPVIDGRSFKSREHVAKAKLHFPKECISRLLMDTKVFAGKSFCIDFEKYAGNLGSQGLFYHDFSLINTKNLN